LLRSLLETALSELRELPDPSPALRRRTQLAGPRIDRGAMNARQNPMSRLPSRSRTSQDHESAKFSPGESVDLDTNRSMSTGISTKHRNIVYYVVFGDCIIHRRSRS
jgi:hypothetical protein